MGIKVFPILIGRGGRVPYPTGTDLFGRTVYEQVEIAVNPQLLESIAKITGATSYSAGDRASLEANLKAVLDTLEKSRLYEASGAPQFDEWATRFYAPAALLGIFALLLRATRLLGAP